MSGRTLARLSIRRMHWKKDGTPKVALNRHQAARARSNGLNTYTCPVCGQVHAGGK